MPIFLLLAATARADDSTAWYGLPAPGPATDQVIDFTHLDLPAIPPPDARFAPHLDGTRAMGYVSDIVAFSYASRAAGERTWGRLAGTRWEEQTVDYVARQFHAAGLTDIVKDTAPFSAPMPVATDWHVTVHGDSGDIELQSAFPMAIAAAEPSASSPQRWSVTAPVVYVGAASAADLAGRDVKGRIVVMQYEAAPAAFYGGYSRAPQRLLDAGALGVLSAYHAPGNMQLNFGGCKNAPCFNLGGEDGDFLSNLIARASNAQQLDSLRVTLSVTQQDQNGPGHVLVARIPGRNSAENLILSAHSDAWFVGANDNASGVAALIALARHYARGPKPQHDIYFFLSPGHHSPTGGTRRLTELHPELAPQNILTINLEHIAQRATYRSYFNSEGMGTSTSQYGTPYSELVPVNWDSPGREISGGPISPALTRIIADAARNTQFTALARIKSGPVAELAAIVAAGATGIQDVETSIWYHTSGDTVDALAPETLQRAMFFYRDLIDQADRLSRKQMRAGAAEPPSAAPHTD
jgi:Peptidase family M28